MLTLLRKPLGMGFNFKMTLVGQKTYRRCCTIQYVCVTLPKQMLKILKPCFEMIVDAKARMFVLP